jgi:hypothetical protein
VKKVIFYAAFLGILSISANAFSQGLFGDDVLIEHRYPNLQTVNYGQAITINEGVTWYYINAYTVNFENDKFMINFSEQYSGSTWSVGDPPNPFNGLFASNIDDVIESVTIDTNLDGWDPEGRVINGDHYLGFDWQGMSFAGKYFNATIEFAGAQTAPEPVSSALFIIGGGAMALLRRRKT